MREKILPVILPVLGLAAGLLLIRNLYVMLLQLPDEAAQGAIYRIMFFHIPSWFVCFTAFFLAGASSIVYLVKKNLNADAFAVAAIETGLVFCCIGLATGMIWARIIWGIWWTWDPRLTWAFITLVVYGGYLMLRQAISDPSERARLSGVLSIFAFTSVMITYKAIDWWRTQHPAPVLSFRTGGGNIDPAMENMLYSNFLALLLLASVMVAIRYGQEREQREIAGLRRQLHAY
jgi:heme exporter protein C